MKRIMAVIVAVLTVFSVVACSKGYQAEKAAGDVKITLNAGRYPLIKGDNTLSIAVSDAGGKPVPDAKVDVHYYMPAMPGMAPMDYPAQPAKKGDLYTFDANIPMEGGWKVDVAVTLPGKPASSATFNLDAR